MTLSNYIHYGDIHTKWHLILDCRLNDSIPHISNEKVKNLPFLQDGDLVIVDASEDYEGVGLSIELRNIGERKIVAGLHTLLLRANDGLLANGFKAYITSMRSVKCSLEKFATGISVYGISKTNLKGIEITFPLTRNEQLAIVKVLDEIQASIGKLESCREKTYAIKQGMLQELLTGKTRLLD